VNDKPLILYEDNHLLIVDKPAGLLTQGDASGRPSLLDNIKAFLKRRDRKPGNVFVGMVQRLDKPVSGVLVFAKTSKAASRVSEQIRNRRVSKYYLAVTEDAASVPSLPADSDNEWHEIAHRLIRIGNKSYIDDRAENSRQALMRLKTLFRGKRCQLHAVCLITGRKHQIRAQLSGLGMPICGDAKYGAKPLAGSERILLHSYCVRLAHPTQAEPVEVFCTLPAEMLAPFSEKEQQAIMALLDHHIF
jgi:23S rRNA pseudouridine1911/1915/1917 synthase